MQVPVLVKHSLCFATPESSFKPHGKSIEGFRRTGDFAGRALCALNFEGYRAPSPLYRAQQSRFEIRGDQDSLCDVNKTTLRTCQ